MDGLELTSEIRKLYNKNEISILAISSNQDEEVTALFLKQGANDYVKKPFSKEEFSCRINNAIEALENIQIVTNHANRDFLTGLYNRRYFFESMAGYEDETKSTGEKFAIAMIDIDHFKSINDTYGHDIGDKVIVALSEILRTSTSHRDIVARFGGEEFCVVLKNINRYSAVDIFNRIREEVENFSFHVDATKNIKFTISIGAVMYNDEDINESINEADMMLYNAKHEGRNKVVFSD
jgi:diguanylate cyclase (GGDEF)-like protein